MNDKIVRRKVLCEVDYFVKQNLGPRSARYVFLSKLLVAEVLVGVATSTFELAPHSMYRGTLVGVTE